MSAPKFSALLLFLIIFLSSVLDSYSTSRLNSRVVGTKSSEKNISPLFGQAYLQIEKPNKTPRILVIVPSGPSHRHNGQTPVGPPKHYHSG